MKVKLNQVYCAFMDMYGIESVGWDMVHLPSSYIRSAMWCEDNMPALTEEYLVWKSLLPIFKQHGVAYYLRIDEFVEEFGKWLSRSKTVTIKIKTKDGELQLTARQAVCTPDTVRVLGVVHVPELLSNFRVNNTLELPTYMHIEVE